MNFWTFIVETNTFNFLIMLAIIAVICKLSNVSSLLEKLKSDIVEKLDNAQSEKESSLKRLSEAKQSVQNLDQELENRRKSAEEKAKAVEVKISNDINKQIEYVNNNVLSVIKSEEKKIESRAIEDTLKSSAKLAEEKIKSALKSDPNLHNIFIEESIKAI